MTTKKVKTKKLPPLRAATGTTVDDKLRDARQTVKEGRAGELLPVLDRTLERAMRLADLAVYVKGKADAEHLRRVAAEHERLAIGLVKLLWPPRR